MLYGSGRRLRGADDLFRGNGDMMLKEQTLFGLVDKVAIAIERLQHFEPPEGYYLAFSGGKDSIVIKELAVLAKIKHDSHYSVTSIDPPELVRFIRTFPEVSWERPEVALLTKLVMQGFPQRQRRWCCELYKENGGNDRCVITGIRSAESYNRSRRKVYEHCYSGGYKSKNKTFMNPIIDWTDDDVWAFIKEHKLPYCSLYDEGWKRIGCLFCPMAGKQRLVAAERYPLYVRAFVRAFERLYRRLKEKQSASIDRWASGEEMFWWWLKEDRKSEDKGQKKMVFE